MLEHDEPDEARQIGRVLLQGQPNWVSVLNNWSRAGFITDHWAEGFAHARRVLELEPQNALWKQALEQDASMDWPGRTWKI